MYFDKRKDNYITKIKVSVEYMKKLKQEDFIIFNTLIIIFLLKLLNIYHDPLLFITIR